MNDHPVRAEEVLKLISELRDPKWAPEQHDLKAIYRTRPIALFERAAEMIEGLTAKVTLERNRASVLLEAAYEAADWLGPGDSVADAKLVPAILEADGDPDYARGWAEDRGFFASISTPGKGEG